MTPARWGAISAAFLGLVAAVINVLVLVGAVHWSTDTVAGVNTAFAAGAAFIGAIFITPPAPKS